MNAHLDLSILSREAEQLDELCGGDERLFHDMLLGETNIDRIVLRIHDVVQDSQGMAKALGERIKEMQDREKRLEQRADSGKAMIGKALRIARLSKLELPEVTYSVRDGKPSLKIVDAKAVPEAFTVSKPTPDKRAINEAYEDSDQLPNWLVREEASDVVTARTK